MTIDGMIEGLKALSAQAEEGGNTPVFFRDGGGMDLNPVVILQSAEEINEYVESIDDEVDVEMVRVC